ncbi:phage protease [Nesterenkonia rhizosphaerae]
MADEEEYVTISGIELLKTGTWDASTGEVSITLDVLENIVKAWASKLLPLAVVKIGHTDPRFENPDWDGEPVYGQIDNLRVRDDGNGQYTLLGDWVNAPKSLAAKQKSAYPQRSVEVDFDVELRDETGTTMHLFPAVLTGLALLGASAPAVQGLADVHSEFAARAKQKGARLRFSGRRTALSAPSAFSLPGGHTQQTLDQALRQAVRSINAEGEYARFWLIDWTDTHAFYEDDAWPSRTYQRPYSIASDGTATWAGDPVEVTVRHTFEPVNAPEATVPQLGHAENESGLSAASPVAETPDNEGEGEMALNENRLKVLRRTLGLGEDATEEEVYAALDSQAEADTSEAPTPDESQGQPEAQEKPEQVAASKNGGLPEEIIPVTKSAFSQMQSELSQTRAEVAELREEKRQAREDEVIHAALSAGKISPEAEGKWRGSFKKDEQGTSELLDSLPANPALAHAELGSAKAKPAHDGAAIHDQNVAKVYDGWFNIPTDKEGAQ